MSWPVFIVEPSGLERRWLRRFAGEGCPANGGSYHNAITLVGDVAERHDEKGYAMLPLAEDVPGNDDPRWPTVCEGCGRPFAAEEEHQLFRLTLYRRVDGGPELWPARELPAGAMYDAWWFGPYWYGRCPDGRYWTVMCPDGREWMICGEAKNGAKGKPGWTVSGTAPKLTANPSILMPGYHGWLRDGVLTDDLDGRVHAPRS